MMPMQDVLEPKALTGSTPVASDRLCIDRIRRTLHTETVGFEIHLFDAIVSTSDVLRRLAETGARDGAVVLAETQCPAPDGFGREWCSPEGTTFSAAVLVRRRISASDVPGLMFVAALALTDAMIDEGIRAEARWPGSVVIDAHKVAEADAGIGGSIARIDDVILGVHVGIDALRDVDRNRLVAGFLNHLEQWLCVHATQGPAATLAAWKARRATRSAPGLVTTN
jgi:biotin-(acetyl-CoA carboxylase) ligase